MTTLKQLIESLNLQSATYQEICDRLNEKPLIANPVTQTQVPAPLDSTAIVRLVEWSELLSVTDLMFQTWIKTVNPSTEELKDKAKTVLLALSGRDQETLLASIEYLIRTQNKTALSNLIELLVIDGKISSNTAAAIALEASQTIPDPNWQSQVEGRSLAEENGLGFVTPEMVQAEVISWG